MQWGDLITLEYGKPIKDKYPPEGMDDAVQTVMTQCELWTDNMEE